MALKRTPLRRRPKKRVSAAERQRSYRWYVNATQRGCVMCKHFPPVVDKCQLPDVHRMRAHHVVPKAALKQRWLDNEIYNDLNAMGLCEYHHARHHSFTQRVPRSVLTADHEHFALTHNLMWLLDEEYPRA